jgi:uncharacterized protein YfaS (alpha-2-macroglobulin family)
VKLLVPDFNGSLRVSAMVYSGNRYGSKDSETIVRAPVLAEASLPRVLAPGDRSSVTLDVQNFTGRAGEFKVQLDGIGPLSLSRCVAYRRSWVSTARRPIPSRSLPARGTRLRRFACASTAMATASIELRRAGAPAWSQVMRSRTRVLDEMSPVQLGADLVDGLMPGSVQARMVVSALPPIPFAAALEDALKYPYGCAEQTTEQGLRCARTRTRLPRRCWVSMDSARSNDASAWKARSGGLHPCR